ncbi:hypothetical protein F5883DRAFT_721719 [Diaporthe sp. PMI_573]|nr:hypothetical protein F5883DRAFT_721719 [Diaporthaceae sp. PMI_573]
MALQLVCKFSDRYSADPDSTGQHFQNTCGPGGTGKSRVIEALKWVFSKLVLVAEEVSRNPQSLRGCADKPLGGIPVVLLMEDFDQFAPEPFCTIVAMLGALLDRLRAGAQTQQDVLMLNTKIVDRAQAAFSTGLRAITPLNRNRWSLDMEAVVDWARSRKRHISHLYLRAYLAKWNDIRRQKISLPGLRSKGMTPPARFTASFSTPKAYPW